MYCFLAIADGGDALQSVVAASAHFAKLIGGEAHALHVKDPLAVHRASTGSFVVGPAIGALIDDSKAAAKTRASAARKAYEVAVAATPNPRFVELDGDEAELTAAHCRLCDLVVVGRPGADKTNPEPSHVKAAIFHSARPVMVVPPQWRPAPLAHAVVAWNGSAQAARALGYAVPLLRLAARTTVVSIGAERERADTAPVAAYLARHGIAAAGKAFDAGPGSARARGRALLRFLDQAGGDLLVMGAYGQAGMLRFLGLGGATAKIITGCPVPVLLAH